MALLVFRPRPGSPPRVRHPPRPRPRLLPHTRLFAWVRPNPEPSYRLVQETQAGHEVSAIKKTDAAICTPLLLMT